MLGREYAGWDEEHGIDFKADWNGLENGASSAAGGGDSRAGLLAGLCSDMHNAGQDELGGEGRAQQRSDGPGAGDQDE